MQKSLFDEPGEQYNSLAELIEAMMNMDDDENHIFAGIDVGEGNGDTDPDVEQVDIDILK